jgi:hypothetical protein
MEASQGKTRQDSSRGQQGLEKGSATIQKSHSEGESCIFQGVSEGETNRMARAGWAEAGR